MTDLDAIRERHWPALYVTEPPGSEPHCGSCLQSWGETGCDTAQALARVAELEAALTVERLAFALPDVMSQEECDEVYGPGSSPIDHPDEWFDTPRNMATAILDALLARPEPKP